MLIFLTGLIWLVFEVRIAAFPTGNFTSIRVNNTCSTKVPSLMIPISPIAPTISFQNSSLFVVSQETREDLTFDLLLSIQVPENSYGCQLELRFPYGYHTNAVPASRVEFWNVEGTVSPNSSWTNAPQRSIFFGSALMQNGTTKTIINSSRCHEMHSLRACVANSKRGGIVVFDQLLSEGLILTYDC